MIFRAESPLMIIDRARRTLGYETIVKRDRAMELTLDWVKHSRVLQGH